MPARANGHDKYPHEVWTQKKPLLKSLKVFGCQAYVHVPSKKKMKLDTRSTLCRFLRFLNHEKAYRFEELSSSWILVSRDAQFMEDTFESGKRVQASDSKAVKYFDANEETSDDDSDDRGDEFGDEGMDEQAPEPASTNEWLQWQQPYPSNRQPQRSQQQQIVEYPPGSMRHLRTHSLKGLSEPPMEERYGA